MLKTTTTTPHLAFRLQPTWTRTNCTTAVCRLQLIVNTNINVYKLIFISHAYRDIQECHVATSSYALE